MFVVYMNAGSIKKDFMGYNSEKDAIECADSFDWEMVDGNGFCWDLTVEEVDGNADDYYIQAVVNDYDDYDDYDEC